MAKKAQKQADPKPLSDEGMLKIIDEACYRFEGDCTQLESAVGALVWGRVVGWHALRLMHSGRTYKKYEQILGIEFRDVLPARTPQSKRMAGIALADNIGKFWQAVTSGLVPAREAQIATAG